MSLGRSVSGVGFRGGKKRQRDRWYGADQKPDFKDFKRWYHRTAKKNRSGRDIRSREEVEDLYDEWTDAERPMVKFLTGSYLDEIISMIASKNEHPELDVLKNIKPDRMSDEQREIVRELLKTTSSPVVRNEAALLLADSGDDRAGSILIELLRRPETRGSRGTLLYALEVLKKDRVPLKLLVDLALTDTYETCEQAVDLICAGLYEASAHERLDAVSRLEAAQRGRSPHTRFLAGDALAALRSR